MSLKTLCLMPVVAVLLSACAGPLPKADPGDAWIGLKEENPNDLMAERVDGKRVDDILRYAIAIGVGAANLVEPYACKTIIENLPAVMERYGMENLTEIIGGAHHG